MGHHKPKSGQSLADLEPELCKEWAPRNELPPTEYTRSSGQKVFWICSKSHEWMSRIADRSDSNKRSGCPYCFGRYPILHETDLQTLEPELCKEWDYFKNKLSPTRFTKNSGKKVWWICPDKGHEYFARISHRSDSNKRSGCPYCFGRYPILHETDLQTLEPELCKEWDYFKNEKGPEKFTRSSGQKVFWICDKGHGWSTTICHRTNMKSGCPICVNSGTSKIEQALCASLNGVSSKVPNTSESKCSMWNVDILLGDTIIEFDGSYFHSLKGAFAQDKRKTLDLLSQGYRVIRIREKCNGCEAKPLKIKHTNYHELFWEHNESTYPSELPDELLDKIRDICYS